VHVAKELNPYHVESDHIAERDLSGFVALNEPFVYQNWTASSGQAQNEWLLRRRLEGLDAFYVWPLAGCERAQGMRRGTNDIVGNVLGCGLGIVSDDEPPTSGKRADAVLLVVHMPTWWRSQKSKITAVVTFPAG
jgi:hypothetical protein